ncbi:hypothetical protein CAPTEDRAFT_192689 [Capitella teleta]|uniref:Uncharacterized protein n=1 Tax=Capitella teleta TaxID=283909 RepID=R7TS68_CAPTE|nr:hypothetical protein CAPTEDRAFT_192689 [Capitella teleta]|eukprot:ELT96447.1 hypothetical protein CAPTEDRAFT_192689 [Capitella teleta]
MRNRLLDITYFSGSCQPPQSTIFQKLHPSKITHWSIIPVNSPSTSPLVMRVLEIMFTRINSVRQVAGEHRIHITRVIRRTEGSAIESFSMELLTKCRTFPHQTHLRYIYYNNHGIILLALTQQSLQEFCNLIDKYPGINIYTDESNSLRLIYFFVIVCTVALCMNFHFKRKLYYPGPETDLRPMTVAWPKSTAIRKATTDSKTVDAATTSNEELPICTNYLFKKYLRAHHSYPEEFQWYNDDHFNLKLCSVPEIDDLPACWKRLVVKKVVQLGDSQGHYYAKGFVDTLKEEGYICKVTRRAKRKITTIPNTAYYYTKEAKAMDGAIHHQDNAWSCTTCISFTEVCVAKDKSQIEIEYIGIVSLKDEFVTFESNSTLNANTFIEFLFKVYFDNNYPGLILFAPPLNQIKKDTSIPAFEDGLKLMMQKLKPTMRKNTRLFFLPGLAEQEKKRPPKAAKYKNKKYHGNLATEQIYLLTRAMWHVLEEDMLSENSNIFSFANIVNATKPARKLSRDGVHYVSKVYSQIMRKVIGTMCYVE